MKDYGQWTFWANSLIAIRANQSLPEIPHRNRAEDGFYRATDRSTGKRYGVAVWHDEMGVWYKKGREEAVLQRDEEAFVENVFAWIARNPIPQDEWAHWSDDVEVPELPSNLAIRVRLERELESLETQFREFLIEVGTRPRNIIEKGKANTFADRFRKLAAKVVEERKIEAAAWKTLEHRSVNLKVESRKDSRS
jgi:hypothetical protein